MLQIKNVKKTYVTGELVQTALNNVSLSLRDSEFVSILGQSGSGKTTLLNIIGGLDRYDSGDLIINGKSTKKYTDRDWDTYRNHTVGFVFQSYNLIPHQSILANVELALTLSGISKTERRKRAKNVLDKVGLGNQIHKKPNQLSGGQMQRVAIARALVNDPEILLADEPTGALDSETGIQVLELLKEVAKDRLVVMVTHNPELAQIYSNRIVRLKDGVIIDDTNPFDQVQEKVDSQPKTKKTNKKSSMSVLTALSLSFNNLKTKLSRTILTSFAGSIGIIGIALILAISSGVNIYIDDLQKETLTSYPISIDAKTYDTTSFIESMQNASSLINSNNESSKQSGFVYTDNSTMIREHAMNSSIIENNLTAFKQYLDNPQSEIAKYIGENGVIYSYDVKFNVYTYDDQNNVIDTSRNVKNKNDLMQQMFGSMLNLNDGATNFTQFMEGKGENLISQVTLDSYDLVYGNYPTEYDQIMLVLDNNYSINTDKLYQLGFLTTEQYNDIKKQVENNEQVKDITFSYQQMCDKQFYLVPFCDYYVKSENGLFSFIGENQTKIAQLIPNALKLKVSGIIKPKADSKNANIYKPLAYTSLLTDYIIDYSDKSAVITAQESDKNTNILTGTSFDITTDEQKVTAVKNYFASLTISEKAQLYTSMMASSGMDLSNMTDNQKASALDFTISKMSDEIMVNMYEKYISQSTYKENMASFGKVSKQAPSRISIYADSFEAKEGISKSIENYNNSADKDDRITYTDYVALLTSSISQIVDIISYVLIAFVAVSLVVSCIMIAIITNISVLERTKEIGILRSIGASKGNISLVFIAETIIIGFLSGLIGVISSYLLTIPINAIIKVLANGEMVKATLSILNALILIAISVVITIVGGIIPAKKAAKQDPVIALRSE